MSGHPPHRVHFECSARGRRGMSPPPPLEVEGYWAGCAGQGGADPHPNSHRSARPWGPWRSSAPLTRPPRLPAPLLRPPQLEYSIPGVLGQELWWQKKTNQNHVRGLFVVQTTSKQQLKTNLDPPRALVLTCAMPRAQLLSGRGVM